MVVVHRQPFERTHTLRRCYGVVSCGPCGGTVGWLVACIIFDIHTKTLASGCFRAIPNLLGSRTNPQKYIRMLLVVHYRQIPDSGCFSNRRDTLERIGKYAR